MTTVIGVIMLGLEPIVFLVGGVYAATVYGGIVGALRASPSRLTPSPSPVPANQAGTFFSAVARMDM